MVLCYSKTLSNFQNIHFFITYNVIFCHSWIFLWRLCSLHSHSVPVRHKWAKKLSELCGFSFLDCLTNALKRRILNSNDRFRICLLNSTGNSGQVWWKWAGLAVLFIKQIQNRLLEFQIECIFLSQGRHYNSFPDFTPSSDASWCSTVRI